MIVTNHSPLNLLPTFTLHVTNLARNVKLHIHLIREFLIYHSSLHIVRHPQTFLIFLSNHLKRQMKMNLVFLKCAKNYTALSPNFVQKIYVRLLYSTINVENGSSVHLTRTVCTLEIMRNHDLMPTFRLHDESLSFVNF